MTPRRRSVAGVPSLTNKPVSSGKIPTAGLLRHRPRGYGQRSRPARVTASPVPTRRQRSGVSQRTVVIGPSIIDPMVSRRPAVVCLIVVGPVGVGVGRQSACCRPGVVIVRRQLVSRRRSSVPKGRSVSRFDYAPAGGSAASHRIDEEWRIDDDNHHRRQPIRAPAK